MPIISNPLLFSEHFSIDITTLKNLGVLNPVLNVDTKLFIDPLLLANSKHSDFKTGASQSYQAYFTTLIKILAASKVKNDVLWRNAERIFNFHEIQGTCLGYGASSIHGSAWGPDLRKQVLSTAKEIINLGVNDPDLFLALALFEDGVGPDRISDMVTNIILNDLVSFNKKIALQLGLSLEKFVINDIVAEFIRNPIESNTPIILLPQDILRELPIAKDWDSVGQAARENEQLRKRVNEQIGEIWVSSVQKDKVMIKEKVLANKEAFLSLLASLQTAERKPYDFLLDKKGEFVWIGFLDVNNLSNYPLSLKLGQSPSVDEVFDVVKQIIDQFALLVEYKGLWKELWAGKKRRPEKSAQRLFFAIADTYCKANGIDLTPEADSGNGPVDFKFSFGYEARLLVEIKLSSNPNIVTGYTKQLEVYKRAESTTRGIYLIIDVGNMGERDRIIIDIKNDNSSKGLPVSEIIIVDGKQKLSASKRK